MSVFYIEKLFRKEDFLFSLTILDGYLPYYLLCNSEKSGARQLPTMAGVQLKEIHPKDFLENNISALEVQFSNIEKSHKVFKQIYFQ